MTRRSRSFSSQIFLLFITHFSHSPAHARTHIRMRSIDGDAKVRGVVAWHQRCGVSRDEAERGRAKREGNGSTERGWLAGLLALCALFQARKPKR